MPLPAPERSLLLASLAFRDLDAASLRETVARVRDWAGVIAAAERVGIEALVYRALTVAGVRGPPAALRRRAEETAVASMEHAALACEAQHALARAGIESLPLKGVALAALEVDYAPLRVVSDVDLLVRPRDLARADAILHDLGFAGGSRGVSVHGRPDLRDRSRPPSHQIPAHVRDGLVIELHDALPDTPGRPLAPPDGLWSRAVTVPAAGATLRVPSREDLLGMLARHVLVHHAYDSRPLPRHVADVHALGTADAALAARLYDVRGDASVARSLAVCDEARALARTPSRDGTSGPERALDPAFLAEEQRTTLARIIGAVRANGWRAVFPAAAYMRALAPERGWSRYVPVAHAQRLGDAAVRGALAALRRSR